MALAIARTRAQSGIDAPPVSVEVHLSNGLPSLNIVGLPEAAVRESKDRVRSALLNAHFDFPARRITINLAPADLPKGGGRFDLPIALGLLAASGQLPAEAIDGYEFIGELALSGELRPVDGVLPSALAAGIAGHKLIVPVGNAREAALARKTVVLGANHLLQVCAHLRDTSPLEPECFTPERRSTTSEDLCDIIGQQQAKRALEIAAAGGHNLLLTGPPGAGKTLLARCLPGLLPALVESDALEVNAIHSVAGTGLRADLFARPFRAPHHTASAVALVGGGSNPLPGEISLAHRGVLFLDELPEFPRKVLEVLREPLESGNIHLSRAANRVEYPADFMLVAAMNPCPCGYLGSERCRCTPDRVSRYREKISGPLLDRIDLQITVPPVPYTELTTPGEDSETSAQVARRVDACRRRQQSRQQCENGRLSARQIKAVCELTAGQRQLINTAMTRLGLSARAYHRVLKVARTIADLAGATAIGDEHLTEALAYRFNN